MRKKMEIIAYLIGGAIVGGSLTFGFINGTKEEPIPIVVPQDEVAKELGKLDVVSLICSPDFIEKQGDGLCRELMCMTL